MTVMPEDNEIRHMVCIFNAYRLIIYSKQSKREREWELFKSGINEDYGGIVEDQKDTVSYCG
jgi:hypothetical protein